MAVVKRKSKKNTTSSSIPVRKRTWEDYLDPSTISLFPGKTEWQDRLCTEMIKFASNPNNLEIMQFCMHYKLPRQTLYDWVAKYPKIKTAFNEMKLIMGANRRVGTFNKKLDGYYAYRDMHCYDPEFIKINEYHADLKKKDDKKEGNITFVVNTDKPQVISKEQLRGEIDDIGK